MAESTRFENERAAKTRPEGSNPSASATVLPSSQAGKAPDFDSGDSQVRSLPRQPKLSQGRFDKRILVNAPKCSHDVIRWKHGRTGS